MSDNNKNKTTPPAINNSVVLPPDFPPLIDNLDNQPVPTPPSIDELLKMPIDKTIIKIR